MSNDVINQPSPYRAGRRMEWGELVFATVLNALVMAVTVSVAWSPDRSTLTGVLILLWGAGASLLAHWAGRENRLDGKWVVGGYLLASLVLYLLLNGVYKIFNL